MSWQSPNRSRSWFGVLALAGIGPRQPRASLTTAARRTSFPNVGGAIGDLKAKTRTCSVCYNITEEDPCAICRDEAREQTTLVVVEEPLDVLAVERTGAYQGRYHVLHGAISPVEGIGPEDLKIRELVLRVQAGGVLEVIVATNPGMEGDATAMYLQRQLAPTGVKVTRLARAAHRRRPGIRGLGHAAARLAGPAGDVSASVKLSQALT